MIVMELKEITIDRCQPYFLLLEDKGLVHTQ